jgi:hypothetical protein
VESAPSSTAPCNMGLQFPCRDTPTSYHLPGSVLPVPMVLTHLSSFRRSIAIMLVSSTGLLADPASGVCPGETYTLTVSGIMKAERSWAL